MIFFSHNFYDIFLFTPFTLKLLKKYSIMDKFVIRKVNSENKSTQKRKNKETTEQELNKKVL